MPPFMCKLKPFGCLTEDVRRFVKREAPTPLQPIAKVFTFQRLHRDERDFAIDSAIVNMNDVG